MPACELLAPVGDREALRAAVANGADAVYFGLSDFNARRRAENFSLADLPEVMRYLRAHNVRGYVALNTVIFSDELPEAARFAARIAAAGADAVIVQDLGLARLIRRMVPGLPIHASTQMTQTEPRGIEILRGLGFSRVILARELSLGQIEAIRAATPMGLEVFVHGALCISYSGQCLASQSLAGRSGNRGLCSQVCRLPWTLVVDGKPLDLGDERHLVSTKDLAAHESVADLVRLGVAGLKIEGRLKGPPYVAAATRVYREALDAAREGRPWRLSREQEMELAQGFSRGFTGGFLAGASHADLIGAQSPKSRGARVGDVVGKTARGIVMQFSSVDAVAVHSALRAPHSALPLKPGDGVVFDSGSADAEPQGGRVYYVTPCDTWGKMCGDKPGEFRPPADARIGPPIVHRRKRPPARPEAEAILAEITFGEGDVDLSAVPVGAAVWKTDDPAIRRRLEQTYARDEIVRRVPLRVRVFATVGEALRLTVADDAGREAEAVWQKPLEEARKHPLTLDTLREQVDRLGDTPFELASLELIVGGAVATTSPAMVPKSVLNDLRRQAVEAVLALREAAARHEIADAGALEHLREAATLADGSRLKGPQADVQSSFDLKSGISNLKFAVLVRTLDQLDAALAFASPRPSLVYCDFADTKDYAAAVHRGGAAGVAVGLATPRILKPGEEPLLETILAAGPESVLVRNLGALGFLRERAPDLALVGDYSLNAANELSAAALAEMGLARLTPSLDLDADNLKAMLGRTAATDFFEVSIHLHVPLFHMEHCPAAARVSGGAPMRGGSPDPPRTVVASEEPAPLQTRRVRRPAAQTGDEAWGRPDCRCPCRAHELALRERSAIDHPILADAACRTTVFNANPRSLLRQVPELARLGVRHFRVEMLLESPGDVERLLAAALHSGTA